MSNADSMNPIAVQISGSLVGQKKDYMGFTYSGDNLASIVYKSGGSGGDTIATLTFAYTGENLTSITRT